ncbi:unnamed protein product [Acanthoscelides obtectus]|nr:unnamed protein product [Acanthoscelides obtectus]CAK1626630.1 Protein peste [Acanthoscelides obtectus]
MSYRPDESFGRMLSWNFRNQTDFYEGHCNDIRGSAGEFYPLNRKRDKLVLYSSELCKYAELEYDRDVVVKGVRGYRYIADNIFDNGTTRPENSCFCKGECIPSGMLNVSACRQDSPSFLSFPHFYSADPYYSNMVGGMKPDRDKHQFYIIIQPKSGIVMEISAKMQVNLLLQPVQHIRLYENVPKVYIPLFYFTQTVHLRDELAENLRMIQSMPDYANYLVIILCFLGLISVCWALCSFFCCKDSRQEKTIKIAKINGNTRQYEEVALNDK